MHMYTHLHTKKTSSLIIINVINQSINKTKNQTRFSSHIVPILSLNAYPSPDQDKPGLTRLTWNTDWAFLDKQTKKNQLSTIAAAAEIFSCRASARGISRNRFYSLFFNTHYPPSHNFYYFTSMFYIKWVILQQK